MSACAIIHTNQAEIRGRCVPAPPCPPFCTVYSAAWPADLGNAPFGSFSRLWLASAFPVVMGGSVINTGRRQGATDDSCLGVMTKSDAYLGSAGLRGGERAGSEPPSHELRSRHLRERPCREQAMASRV
jgi:hypothetical protein